MQPLLVLAAGFAAVLVPVLGPPEEPGLAAETDQCVCRPVGSADARGEEFFPSDSRTRSTATGAPLRDSAGPICEAI